MSFFVLRKISMVENLLFFPGMIRGETDKPPVVGVESATHRLDLSSFTPCISLQVQGYLDDANLKHRLRCMDHVIYNAQDIPLAVGVNVPIDGLTILVHFIVGGFQIILAVVAR